MIPIKTAIRATRAFDQHTTQSVAYHKKRCIMYKKLKDLSATNMFEIHKCIENLYEMLPFDDNTDEIWLHNRLRHILECILTDESYNKLFK